MDVNCRESDVSYLPCNALLNLLQNINNMIYRVDFREFIKAENWAQNENYKKFILWAHPLIKQQLFYSKLCHASLSTNAFKI